MTSVKDNTKILDNNVLRIPKTPRFFKNKIDGRDCEWYNHIPHLTPVKTTRAEWHEHYVYQLIGLYNIVETTINEKYPKNKIKWYNNQKIVNALSKLVYNCSSKYITPYLDFPNQNRYDDENLN